MSFTPINFCRSCGAADLFPVLDLAEQPLANAFRSPSDTSPEFRYPLALVGCPQCSLVQLTGSVTPGVLFDDYSYFSSFSDTMVAAMRALAHRATEKLGLGPHSLVVDVGSNDGYLLKHYVELGVPVLGVEPAANVAAIAIDAGVPTISVYFGTETARAVRAEHGAADVIHANNVMAHAPDINDFAGGLAALLADGGTAYVESPYLRSLIDGTEFDTVYHEHVFYFSLTAMDIAVRRHGLAVTDIEPLTIHGGTLRYTIRRHGEPVNVAVDEMLMVEASSGIGTERYFYDFAHRVEMLGKQIVRLLSDLKDDGARIAAYGAAAKGTVLLNYCGIGPELVDVVVDRNPHKQSRLMPGVGIRITDPSYLADFQPTHLMVLAWNLADEIIAQQHFFRSAGGQFIIPIPELRVLR